MDAWTAGQRCRRCKTNYQLDSCSRRLDFVNSRSVCRSSPGSSSVWAWRWSASFCFLTLTLLIFAAYLCCKLVWCATHVSSRKERYRATNGRNNHTCNRLSIPKSIISKPEGECRMCSVDLARYDYKKKTSWMQTFHRDAVFLYADHDAFPNLPVSSSNKNISFIA